LSFGASPSLLNGTGDSNLISSAKGARGSDSLLSLPSPPQSRASSADGSYQTDVTQFEDVDNEPEDRGRPKSQDTLTDKRISNGKDSKGNVIVSVRVRPDAAGDSSKPEGEWMVDGRRSLIAYNGREGGDYRYDNVFSPNDDNARVYDSAAKRLVRRVMEGYHGTVFAYGMTGTGKTFSMQGTAVSPGVIPLAISDIFSYIRENPNREFLLRVSYLEIYNEKIYDLLSQSTPGVVQEQDIKLREDSKRGVYATPLKEEIVQSPNQLLRVIARGDMARRTGSTQYNVRSSRSHAVVQIVVESRARAPNHGAYFEKEQRRADKILPGGVLVSTLSLIDLAGSERAAEDKERRTEGAHINKSLLTLGTVIARLSGEDEKEREEGSKSTEKDKEKSLKHLPYRDSKLTRLLQPALSGNSLVSILCTIQLSSAGTSAAAAGLHTGETLNTLKFASRAKNNIVSHAKRNESHANAGDAGSRALLDRYRLEIQELRTQLEQQTKVKEEAEAQEEIEKDKEMEAELERQEQNRHEEQMLEMQLARTALKERISHLNRLILSSKSLGVNSGRMSSMSLLSMPGLNRMSNASANNEYGRPVSQHSSHSVHSTQSHLFNRDSTATLEVPLANGKGLSRAVSVGSITSAIMPAANVSRMEESEAIEEDDGEVDALPTPDGDSEATLAQQNRMLQADLADKNRYITTLEKRLLQARRTSHSRVSMQLATRASHHEASAYELSLREKDKEIEELKARLDDQTRMVNALRSAARKRDIVDLRKSASAVSEATERPASASAISNGVIRKTSSRLSNRSLKNGMGSGHKSNPSNASRSSSSVVNFSKTPLSPMTLLSPTGSDRSDDPAPTKTKALRRRSVDEMTMLLDQMIQDKVDSGHVVRGERGSLRIKRDTVMEKNGFDAEGGADNSILEVDEHELSEG
jgi:centromeric protein E